MFVSKVTNENLIKYYLLIIKINLIFFLKNSYHVYTFCLISFNLLLKSVLISLYHNNDNIKKIIHQNLFFIQLYY